MSVSILVVVHQFISHANSQKDFEKISVDLEDLIKRFRPFSKLFFKT